MEQIRLRELEDKCIQEHAPPVWLLVRYTWMDAACVRK